MPLIVDYNIACHADLAISWEKRDIVGANQPAHINMAKDAPKPGSAPQTPPATPPTGM